MTGDLSFLLIGFLLQGALCGKSEVTVPKSIEVLSGSCVTIPCSFDVLDKHISLLDGTCRALWKSDVQTVFDSSNPQSSVIQGELKGDLTRKDCSTTLNNMRPEHSKEYFFRLQCDRLGNNYVDNKLNISVTDIPRTPTLTPSTLKVEEGTSVSLTCSAPAPCLSHPPALTWSSSLGHIQESLQEDPDRTKVQTSVLNFTASRIHHGKIISCIAVYNKQDGSSRSSVSASLTLSVSYTPQILSSYDCIQTADQLNCSCETVGNPPPALQWYLSGLPVNHSDRFAISSEPLNVSGMRSIITVNQPQGKDLHLSCHSSNSLGSTTQRFFVSRPEPQACSCRVLLPVFISIAGLVTAALVCVLLVAIRAVWRKPTKSECSGDTSRGVMSRGLTGEMDNKVSITSEEDIYVNTNEMRQLDKPETQLGHQHVANQCSEKQDEEGSDVLYASVDWKSKKKRTKKEDHSGENNFYLEEERCTGKNAQEAASSEYAQVTFR